MYRSEILNGLMKRGFFDTAPEVDLYNKVQEAKARPASVKVSDSREVPRSAAYRGGSQGAQSQGFWAQAFRGFLPEKYRGDSPTYTSDYAKLKQDAVNFAGGLRLKTLTPQDEAYMGGVATQMSTNGDLQADATAAWAQYAARGTNQQRTEWAEHLLDKQKAAQPKGMSSMERGIYNTTMEKARAVENGALQDNLQKDIFTTSTGAGNALYLIAKKYGFDLPFFKNNPYIIPTTIGVAGLGLAALVGGGEEEDDEDNKQTQMQSIVDKYLGRTATNAYHRQIG